LEIKIQQLNNAAIIPEYKSEGAAGFDLHASNAYLINPAERVLVGTGLAFEIPEGYEMQVRPRSGLALKEGITVLNSPGTVDSDYRGEVGIILINHGTKNFIIHAGERIAQGVIAKVEQATFTTTHHLSATDRGTGGFGSSGKA
jgi:dUTP pyrophosphatase